MNRFCAAIIAVIAILIPGAVSAAYLDSETGEMKGDASGSSYNIIFTEDIDVTEDSEFADESLSIKLLSESDSGEIDYTQYYGRRTLAAEENGAVLVKIYDAIDAAARNGVGKSDVTQVVSGVTELSEIVSANFMRVLVAYENDNPQYITSKEIDSYNVSYERYGILDIGLRLKVTLLIDGNEITNEKKAEIAQKQEKIEAVANKIIANSGIDKKTSDYEKALLLHDYLAYIVQYHHQAAKEQMEAIRSNDDALIKDVFDKYPNVHNVYGALIDKKCVCDGYAKAYQYLLYKVGILSHIATGYGKNESHAWNLVKLDGDWYYTDLTWDDQESGLFHSYFDVTTETLTLDHTIDERYYNLPDCTTVTNNYFVKNKFSLDVDNIAEQLDASIYATVYTTEKNTSEVWEWYKQNIKNIINKIHRTGNYPMKYSIIDFGGEYHLALGRSEGMLADKDFNIIIDAPTGGDFKLLQIFYNENNVIMGTNITDLTFETAKPRMLQLHPEPGFDGYKRVKYMLWDSVNGLRPIGNSDNVNY